MTTNNEIEFPRQYDYIDGGRIRREWAGHKTPIPPRWVRDRLRLPQSLQYACLSKDLDDVYPEETRAGLVKYVAEWPENREYGTDLLIGGRGHYLRQSWAAAAVLNEINMRYAQFSDVASMWFSTQAMGWVMENKQKGSESYASLKTKLYRAKLLVVQGIMRVPPSDEGVRWWLLELLEHRAKERLPTITTFHTNLKAGGWDAVEAVLGPFLTEILQSNHNDNIVTW